MPLVFTRRRIRHMTLHYWALVLLGAGWVVYAEGARYRDACISTEGVAHQLLVVRDGRAQRVRPLFRYVLAGDTLYSVAPNADQPPGTRVRLLVSRAHAWDIEVYDYRFWIARGFSSFPVLLFGGLLYTGLLLQARTVARREALLARYQEQEAFEEAEEE
ncbi:MAG: hypothetical protein EOO11_08430 [Chitinophagaceae bacterium]|nr:MAG: hypothetical protein EOO11_08430 [Chitinophagaceae bacterium]